MPWSLFNRVDIKHVVSGALKGLLLEEKPKSKWFRIHQRGTFQEQKVRSDAYFAPAIHNAYKHTDRKMS